MPGSSDREFSVPAIWNGMGAAMGADLSRLFFVAAPFTLLLSVAVDLFGPPPPATLSDISTPQLIWRLALPSILGTLAQLAVCRLVLEPGAAPREALAAALALFPAYLVVQLLAAVPVGLGLLLLLVPGVYLFARLSFLSTAVAVAEGGGATAILSRSWALSDGRGLTLLLFVLLGLFAVIGIGILAEGAGAAIDVVARALGIDTVGRFLHALAVGIGGAITAVGMAAASAAAYRGMINGA